MPLTRRTPFDVFGVCREGVERRLEIEPGEERNGELIA